MTRIRRSANFVAAAFTLAACVGAPADLDLPPTAAQRDETAIPDAGAESCDAPTDIGAAIAPAAPPARGRSGDPAVPGDADGAPHVSGVWQDGALAGLACSLEGIVPGADTLGFGISRGSGGAISLFDVPPCDPLEYGPAGCGFLDDSLALSRPAPRADDHDRLLKLDIYESRETGDVRLIWEDGAGVGLEWRGRF